MPLTQQGGPFPQTSADAEIINFGLGQPSPSLLPIDMVSRAAGQLQGEDPLVLQYGRGPGYLAFREALAAFLTEGYGHSVGPDELAVTGGTSLGLALVSQLFATAGDRVICGDPTYFLAHGIFATQRLATEGVPVDDEGLDVEALEARLHDGPPVSFVYCIPTFQNPRGVCLHPDRARRLVDLAEAHDFVVVADEPYNLLHFGARPPCMMRYDEGRGRVLSLGSFSKILAPGMRLGWVHAAPTLIERYLSHGALRSGGCLNPVMARIVQGTLDDGSLRAHCTRLRDVLGRRAARLSEALTGAGLPHRAPEGGYFTWVELDPEVDTTALLEKSRADHAVGFCPGARCAVERDLRRYLRLSFAFYDEDEIALGVERLASALRG